MIVKNLIISCHGSDSKMTKKDPCLLIIQGRLVMPENEGLRVKGEGFPGLEVNKKEGHCISHRACWKHFYLTDSLHKHIKAAKFYQIMSVIHGQHRPLNIFIGPRSDHSLPLSVTNSLTDWVMTLLKIEWIDLNMQTIQTMQTMKTRLCRLCRLCRLWRLCRLCKICRISRICGICRICRRQCLLGRNAPPVIS